MDESIRHALWLTLWVSAAASLIGLVVGVAIGFALARLRFPGRDLLDALILLPMVLPPTVLGYYLLVIIGQRSGIGGWLEAAFGVRLVFTPAACVLAACMSTIPLVAKTMRGAFATMDPVLEDMACVDGADPSRVHWHIHLPQVLPPLIAAVTMAFARAVGDFGVTIMVAGSIPGRTQTASLAIYDMMMAGRDRDALVLSLIVSAMCIVVVWLSAKAGRLYRGR